MPCIVIIPNLYTVKKQEWRGSVQALGSTSENFRHHHCIGGVWVMASAFWVKGLGVLSFELDESRKAPELKGKREEGDFFFLYGGLR